MKVNNIFSSLQGEGLFAGVPSVFLRLHECNLRCSYCDAIEAVSGEDYSEMTSSEISKKILSFPDKDLCITGGEPLLQEDGLVDVITKTMSEKRVSIETNGTLPIKMLRNSFPFAYFSLDWKMPSSGNAEFLRENLLHIKNRGWIKFVVGDINDLDYAVEMIKTVTRPDIEFIISPVFEKGAEWFKKVSYFCMENNFSGRVRFQLQLHKLLGIE